MKELNATFLNKQQISEPIYRRNRRESSESQSGVCDLSRICLFGRVTRFCDFATIFVRICVEFGHFIKAVVISILNLVVVEDLRRRISQKEVTRFLYKFYRNNLSVEFVQILLICRRKKLI